MENLSQVSKLVGVLVEHQKFFELLSTEDRQWIIQNPKEAIGLFIQTVQDRSTRTIPNLDVSMPKVFRLVIDYGVSLEQMIAAGHYDRIEGITEKNFPIYSKGVVEFEVRYFCFGREIYSENAIKKIEEADKDNPWSPAKIEHVLSFGATFPEEQHKYPIIGLGSVVTGERKCWAPQLVWDVSERRIHLCDKGRVGELPWNHVSRFLAVRKVSVS